MRCVERNELADSLRSRCTGLDAEVVEIPLLLPGWQVVALERAAQGQGLTTAEMVRRLIRDFCCSDGSTQRYTCYTDGQLDRF